MESVIDSSLKKRNAGNKEMDEIAFQLTGVFLGYIVSKWRQI